VVDIHCHILPGFDFDGPRFLDQVLEMARLAVADGILQTVATPHIYGTEVSPQKILNRVVGLNEALRAAGISLEVLPGAEASGLLDPKILKEYAINGTKYVLFEFPHSHLPQNAGELIFRAVLTGLKPIIAHPERNPTIFRSPEILFELIESGALSQITADSLCGHFGPEAQECSVFLLKKKAVHFLASDAHSPLQRRPVLSKAVDIAAKIVGKSAAFELVTSNPAAVIAGVPLHV
jgi:protein-tyrosine phosphatase